MFANEGTAKFASAHANAHNHFNQEHHLVDRQTYKERRSAHWPSGKASWHEAAHPKPLRRQSETSCD